MSNLMDAELDEALAAQLAGLIASLSSPVGQFAVRLEIAKALYIRAIDGTANDQGREIAVATSAWRRADVFVAEMVRQVEKLPRAKT